MPYCIGYFQKGLSANVRKAALRIGSFPYSCSIDNISTSIDSIRRRDSVNVQVEVVNIFAKVRPTNFKNNEVKRINFLQKSTLLALSQ